MVIPVSLPGLLLAHLFTVFCLDDTELLEQDTICEFQCDVFCRENQQEPCGAGCLSSRGDVWEKLCQDKQSCVGNCVISRWLIKDRNYVCRIPEVHVYIDTKEKHIILQWDRDPKCENLTVIYIIQGQTPVSEWLVLNSVKNNTEYVMEMEDFCANYRFRVAAVTRHGTRGFSRHQYLIPKPMVSFQPSKLTYNSSKDEFYTDVLCEVPHNENRTDVYCEWDPPFKAQCTGLDIVQPIVRQILGGPWFQIGVARAGFGCSFKGRVRLKSNCGAHGDWTEVYFAIKDCSQVSQFPCPPRVISPGVVGEVKFKHEGKSVHLEWQPPGEKGSMGIAGYAVQWGICRLMPMPGFGPVFALDHKQIARVTKTEFILPVSGRPGQYGARVAALGPGQDISSIRFGILHTFCTQKDWHSGSGSSHGSSHGNHGQGPGHVVFDEEGVIILHYPPTPRLLISWLSLPYRDKKKEAVKQYALRWGPLSEHGDGRQAPGPYTDEDSLMEVENSILIPANFTELNITVDEPGKEYGLQLCQLHSPVEGDDEVEWNMTKVLHFAVPPVVNQSSTSVSSIVEPSSDVPSIGAAPADTTPELESKSTLVSSTTGDRASTQLVGKLTHSLPNGIDQSHLIVFIAVPCSAGLLLMVVIIGAIHRKRKRPRLVQSMTRGSHGDDDRYNIIRFTHSSAQFAVSYEASGTPVPDKWEIPRVFVETGPILGTGAFGQVVKGRVSRSGLSHEFSQSAVRDTDQSPDTNLSSDIITVAIKMLQEDIEDTYRQDFLKEIKLMKSIGCHTNIVSMLGCCTVDDPVCLVVEHVPNGDLLSYLRDVRVQYHQPQRCSNNYTNMAAIELTSLDLLSFARQIAVGMEFLSQKGYVHRDLAARNVLVGEHKTLKIGDFGLARYVYDDKVYVNRRGGKLPIKWMSIEAIFDLTFSAASDVWSFGIVMFEICTLGGTPYPTLDNTELLSELRRGWRMPNPEGCSPQLYQLMLDCWKEVPSDRPTFTSLRQSLESMMEQNSSVNYIHLSLANDTEINRRSVSSEDITHEDERMRSDSLHRAREISDSGQQSNSSGGGSSAETTDSLNAAVSLEICSQAMICDSNSSTCTKDVDDDVFDSAPLCDCSHRESGFAFTFGESCSDCGKLQGPFQDKMSRLGALMCHSEESTGHVSSVTGEFLLRSDCVRSDRIESDISTSTCSSGEFLIQQETPFKERSLSRDSEVSVSSSTCLLSSPKRLEMSIPGPPPTEYLQETRL